mmetsp:Transcript_64821/g.146192  ORF Transcript_64821/g.146192 Transcript_64821/m.146192 type:complete len:228 (-) Transcript_64821:90-773(-)
MRASCASSADIDAVASASEPAPSLTGAWAAASACLSASSSVCTSAGAPSGACVGTPADMTAGMFASAMDCAGVPVTAPAEAGTASIVCFGTESSGSQSRMGIRRRHSGHRTTGTAYRISPVEWCTWALRHPVQKTPWQLPMPQGAATSSSSASKQMPQRCTSTARPNCSSGGSVSACRRSTHQSPMSVVRSTPRLQAIAATARERSAPAASEVEPSTVMLRASSGAL